MTLAHDLRNHLTRKILPFWEKLMDPVHGGFYGYMDKDLHVNPDAHKGCILNSRILWTFSTATRVLGDDRWLIPARQAYDFLPHFEDQVNGGVFWSVSAQGQPLDTTKHTYCQAFTIYGLAAYYRATGEQAALDKALALFDVIERKCRDEGGYLEAGCADFSPAGNEKLSDNPVLMARGQVAQRTMNTLLHVLEAYAELYRASRSEAVRLAGVRCLEQFLHVLYNEPAHRLEVFFDRDYHSLLDMQSYGHDIEASWLMWDAAVTLLPEEQRAPYQAMCLNLAQAVCERAFTPNGLENEVVEGQVEHTLIWWVQAETVLGFANAWALTGDTVWAERTRQQWETVQRMMVDPRENGEWYWSTDAAGKPTDKPIVEEWKCPYHNGRMCLYLLEQACTV